MQPPEVQIALEQGQNVLWKEGAARLQFISFFLLYFLIATAAFCKFCCDAKFLFESDSCRRLAWAFLLCAAAGIGVIISVYGLGILPETFQYFDKLPFCDKKSLFSVALEHASQFGSWSSWWGSRSLTVFMATVNIVALLAVPASIAGGISCLGTSKKDSPKECWVVQQERLQTYIYLSAALLVISIVFLKVWTQYPSFMMNKDATKAYNEIVNSYSVFMGIEYTLLLASFALPVSMILSQRANQIAEQLRVEASPDGKRLTIRDIRAEEKLTISSQDVFKTIIALLSPLITGSIASLASVVH